MQTATAKLLPAATKDAAPLTTHRDKPEDSVPRAATLRVIVRRTLCAALMAKPALARSAAPRCRVDERLGRFAFPQCTDSVVKWRFRLVGVYLINQRVSSDSLISFLTVERMGIGLVGRETKSEAF